MNFIPSPGIILVEPIEKEETHVIIQGKINSRILKGEVIAIGENLQTNFGAELPAESYVSGLGDFIYFLSYEGDYDLVKIEGKPYRLVKFEDCRGTISSMPKE